MRRTSLTVSHSPSEAAAETAQMYGYACLLMSVAAGHRERTVTNLRSLLEPAIAHGQLKLYFNDNGNPVAYVAWALLDGQVEDRVLSEGRLDLHHSEWNEGQSLWIVDFVAPFGHLRHVLADLRDNVFRERAQLRYCRRRNGAVVHRCISRSMRASFFARAGAPLGKAHP